MQYSPASSTRTRALRAGLTALAVATSSAAAFAQEDFSTWDNERKEHFLLHGEVIEMETLPTGVTRSAKIRLRLDGVEHDAHWQNIDLHLTDTRIGNRVVRDFYDSYRYNIAAYRLDHALGLGMVPVTVERRLKRKGNGAVTWWIDDVQMMEKERNEKGIQPPDSLAWQRQIRKYHVFTQLVANTDANATNLLITDDWTVWLIDFTRAFRNSWALMDHPSLTIADSDLIAAMKQLDKKELKKVMGKILTPGELGALFGRRNKVVEQLEEGASLIEVIEGEQD
jgi:hypothetical protein